MEKSDRPRPQFELKNFAVHFEADNNLIMAEIVCLKTWEHHKNVTIKMNEDIIYIKVFITTQEVVESNNQNLSKVLNLH